MCQNYSEWSKYFLNFVEGFLKIWHRCTDKFDQLFDQITVFWVMSSYRNLVIATTLSIITEWAPNIYKKRIREKNSFILFARRHHIVLRLITHWWYWIIYI